MIPITLLTILLLTSCAGNNTLNPSKNHYTLVIQFYDTTREVEKVCGKWSEGCHKESRNVDLIHLVKKYCVLYHELDHVFYGAFHDNMKSSCKVRNED